jgi:hypothetical protein
MKRVPITDRMASSKIMLNEIEFYMDGADTDQPRKPGDLDIYYDFDLQCAAVWNGQSWRNVSVKWEQNGYSIDIKDLK